MSNTNKTISIFISILLLCSSVTDVYARSVEKQAVLAVLTLNVARFTSWPEQAKSILNFCIIGDNIVQQSFENIDSKVINNRTIHIINLSRLRNLEQCQLLYVSELERNRLVPLLAELRGQATLTIGENIEFLQASGMVGLERINGKIQLNINLSSVKESNLLISSRLLKLANIVSFPTSTY